MENKYKYGWSAHSLRNILNTLHSNSYTVIVPEIALYTDAEVEEQINDTEFLDGVPVRLINEKNNRKKTVNKENRKGVSYTKISTKGKNRHKELLNRKTVYLSLSTIIDIFNNGYSVYVRDEESVVSIVEFLSDILLRLEANTREKRADEIREYIENFYNDIAKNKKLTVTKALENPINDTNIIGLGSGLLAGSSDTKMETMDISKMKVF